MPVRSRISITPRRGLFGILDDLAGKSVRMGFARVSPYLRSDMDRHRITAAIGDQWIFSTLHEGIAAARGGRDSTLGNDAER